MCLNWFFLGELSHVSVCIRRSFTLPDRTNLPDSYLTGAKPTKTFNYKHTLLAPIERFTTDTFPELKRSLSRHLLRIWLDFRSIQGRIFTVKLKKRVTLDQPGKFAVLVWNLKWYIIFLCDAIILKHLFLNGIKTRTGRRMPGTVKLRSIKKFGQENDGYEFSDDGKGFKN